MKLLPSLANPNSSLKLITITEVRDGQEEVSKWLLLRHRLSVDVERLKRLDAAQSKVHQLSWILMTCLFLSFSFQNIPGRTDIAIAIPLSGQGPLPTVPVYAFLPVRSAGFHFLLNGSKAPFLLPQITDC